MTVQEECPCSETSEASLRTDTTSWEATDDSSTLGPCANNPNKDCTYHPDEKKGALPARGSSPTRLCARTPAAPPANHQPQGGPFQYSTQFEPAMQCLCHAYRVKNLAQSGKYDPHSAERFNWKWPRREFSKKRDKLYEVKVKSNHYRHYSKPYVQGDGTEGIPRKKSSELDKADGDPSNHANTKQELEEISERIDIYYFDHGNSAYYRTTDSPPILATEKCAEKTDCAATRFWAEIFGTIHIGVAFVTAFVLQLLRFILFSVIRPLTVGILQLFADYFIKPFLSIIFNALIQPILIMLYNIATSLRDLCEPVAEALGFFLREVAAVFRALRIVEVNRTNNNPTTTSCT